MAADAGMILRWIDQHRLLARQLAGGGSPRELLRSWSEAVAAAETSGIRPLLLFSQVAWDDVWQRPQEMARGLARERPVLFCSPVQAHQTAGPLAGRWEPLRLEQDGRLMIFSPLILSGEYRAAAVRGLNRDIVARALRPLLRGQPCHFLSNTPFAAWLPRRFDFASVGYDLIDDFCAFDWAPPDGRRMERALIRRSDYGFAGTWSLHERFRSRFPEFAFLPSGVAFDRLTAPTPEPDDLRDFLRPRLLYTGTLNDRIDGELIALTARSFPEATVVLVGPRRATFGDPDFPPNVRQLGLKPHEALPGYYQHCDLGLMPFADNAAARAINPVKTLEYLACGLPVVSTPVPDVKRFYSPPVEIARPEDWPETIARLLAEDSAEARAERRRFAGGRSWEAMADRAEDLLRRYDARTAG